MAKVLIIRLSSMGDVAMTIPVVYAVAEANPDDSFTVLTQTNLLSLFKNRPPNLAIVGVNMQRSAKSLYCFLRFIYRLKGFEFDCVIDLHNVIRSRLAGFFLKKVYIVDKRRKERKRLTRRPPKVILPLRPVTERYRDVFRRAGFHVEETFVSLFANHPVDRGAIESSFGPKTGSWVGIAPFARHQGKIYPLEKMEQVVKTLSEQGTVKIFLFGNAKEEAETMNRWESSYQNTISVPKQRLPLNKEIELLSVMDVLVSMDSANMHLASLTGTKVISIWGATHPFAGFYGYRQREDLAIQVDLPCRPCSVYGHKPCHRRDWACMNRITPEEILRKINSLQVSAPPLKEAGGGCSQ